MLEAFSKKILVVDDEKDVVEILSKVLKRANYEVASTTKGREVLELAKKFKPDLIILDIFMPDMEGSDVAASLLESPVTVNIPVIFLTGAVITKEEEPQLRKTGKHYLMAKPVTERELLDRVREVLSS